MDIHDVFRRCMDAGVRLAESDGQLRVHFDDKAIGADLLALLKEHKAELLQYLRTVPPGSRSAIPILSPAARQQAPATPAQRRMWLIDRFEKAATPYNMVGAFRLEGSLDIKVLAAAVDQVISRHEALRTIFEERDDELFQVVRAPSPLNWEHLDASALGAEAQEQQLQELLRRENRRRFDLANGPVIHVATLRLSGDAVVFVMNMHHIACDGWSIGILTREISAAYASLIEGRPLDWTAPVQYIDYSEWQRTHSDDSATTTQLNHWVRRLDGLPQLHGLPLDKPRPTLQTYAGQRVRRTITGHALQAIRARCEARDVSLFCFLHMAFSALVALYSAERDIVIGFPVACRRHRDVDATVGLFVNTAILRSQVDGDASFDALLDQSRDNIRHAIANQDVPYEALLEALKPNRSRAHSPLVQLLLSVQSAMDVDFAIPDVQAERLDNHEEPVKFDLQLEVAERSDRLEISWRFNADLFESASIERMADGFTHVVELAAQDGEATVHCVAGLSSPMQGPPAASPARRLEVLFEQHARDHPDHTAVVYETNSLSYRELDVRATALACQLRCLGVVAGSRVGLCVDRSIEMVVGILGALKLGAAYVPLDMSYPPQRLAAMISGCDAAVLLGQRRHEAALAQFERPILLLDDAPGAVEPDTIEPGPATSPILDASSPAYVIYTSGTTGVPKGVVVSHASVTNLLAHFDNLAPLQAPWNGTLWSSINFDASVYEIFSPLCAGGCLHIVPETYRLDPERLFAWMVEREIQSAYLYAGYLEPFGHYLANSGARSALRRLLVGVEPISSDHLDAIASHIPELQIVNGYGPTEATVCCTTLRYEASSQAPARRVPIGRAVAGAELYVMNASGKPALPGALGELYVGGASLAIGYLNNPDMTRERFVDKRIGVVTRRLYRTGDVVRCLPSGDLEFIGRADEQVKIRGFRIEPGEIEVRLSEQDEVSDAAVLALGEGADKRLVAFVVPKKGLAVDHGASGQGLVDRIKRELKAFLPDYMIPADIVLLDSIPMTINGKVDRAALPLPAYPQAGAATHKVAPRNDIERHLTEIWKDVLSQEEVGITDDFFALGGHSLHMTRLTSRVRQQFELGESEMSLEVVFENPTVESLATALAAAVRRNDARAKEQYLASLGDGVEEGVF